MTNIMTTITSITIKTIISISNIIVTTAAIIITRDVASSTLYGTGNRDLNRAPSLLRPKTSHNLTTLSIGI